MMQIYTLGSSATGHTINVRLCSHRQHIWHTSEIEVSPRVLARIRCSLGEGPYTNPCGNFGGHTQHIVVYLRADQ